MKHNTCRKNVHILDRLQKNRRCLPTKQHDINVIENISALSMHFLCANFAWWQSSMTDRYRLLRTHTLHRLLEFGRGGFYLLFSKVLFIFFIFWQFQWYASSKVTTVTGLSLSLNHRSDLHLCFLHVLCNRTEKNL